MKTKKTPKLPPQPSGHDLNVGDIVYVALTDKFAQVIDKLYRFEPIDPLRHHRSVTKDPKDFNPSKHVRANDLLTVQSLEGSFANGMTVERYDSFHVQLFDVAFRNKFIYDALAAVNDRFNRLAKRAGLA